MKILIVGGRSSLAYALKPIFLEFAEVITAGREECDVKLDLCDSVENIKFPNDIDVVVNTAAYSAGSTFQEILQTENVNVIGVLKLCQLCSKAQVKHLVHVSSIFAHLDKSSVFYSIYSLSKKHSDEIVQLYSSMFELPVAIIRPSQFFGVGELYRKNQPFLYAIIDKAENNEDILFYGSNDALRNFIHVEDVANSIALVIQQHVEGTYSCMSINNIRYSEVANAAIKAFNSKSKIKFIIDKPDIPDNIFEQDDSLYRLIDYYPQISFSLGMKKEAAYRMRGEE